MLFNSSNRYRVRYKDVLWERKIYKVGELMPIEFTEREVARHINGRRFEVVPPEELVEVVEIVRGVEKVEVAVEPAPPAPIPPPEPVVPPAKPAAPVQLAKK